MLQPLGCATPYDAFMAVSMLMLTVLETTSTEPSCDKSFLAVAGMVH